jgi:exodeoxyribonuclease V alpha subunit
MKTGAMIGGAIERIEKRRLKDADWTRAAEELDLEPVDLLTIGDLGGDEPFAAVAAALFGAMHRGSLCLPLDPTVLANDLAVFGPAGHGLARDFLATLAANGYAEFVTTADVTTAPGFLPLVHLRASPTAPGFLYFHALFLRDQELHRLMAPLLGAPADSAALLPTGLAAAAEEVFTRSPIQREDVPIRFNREQVAAAILGACRPLTIVSGGPGTGKTSIVVALLRLAARLGTPPERILLAASTGLAAFRLRESIVRSLSTIVSPSPADLSLGSIAARTLHRLLGFLPTRGRFRHHRNNPLDADLVVIDEVSMVDAGLMARLLAALSPGTRLVLLGDRDQLPSVESGAVLAWLMGGGKAEFSAGTVKALSGLGLDHDFAALAQAAPTAPAADRIVLLEENYRSEKRIQASASMVRSGLLEPVKIMPGVGSPRDRFDGSGWLRDATGRGAFDTARVWLRERLLSDDRYPKLLAKAASVADFESLEADPDLLKEILEASCAAQILTALHAGPYGCAGINRELVAAFGPVLDPGGRGERTAGLPLIVLENDYRLDLYNGDRGVILRTGAGYRAVFRRESGFRSVPLGLLPTHAPAFAVTVHKSQGSEYDEVLIVLPAHGGERLLSREILYTALTRARRSALLFASESAFQLALSRRAERLSGFYCEA